MDGTENLKDNNNYLNKKNMKNLKIENLEGLVELEEMELIQLDGGSWYDVAYAVGKWLKEHRSYEFETLT